MKTANFKYILMLFILIFLSPAFGAGNGGGTVPWPWPWAEECPIDFESLSGTWVMGNESNQSLLRISSAWVPDQRIQYLVIELVNSKMEIYARGHTFINGTARTIRVGLRDMGGNYTGVMELKIYHRSHALSCEASELVPIVFFKREMDSQAETHYVLKKRGINSPQERP